MHEQWISPVANRCTFVQCSTFSCVFQGSWHTESSRYRDQGGDWKVREDAGCTLKDSLPPFIVIGPFYISCDSMRQKLSKKCKAISTAGLDLLAKKLRHQADEVHFILGSLSKTLLNVLMLFIMLLWYCYFLLETIIPQTGTLASWVKGESGSLFRNITLNIDDANH